MKIQKVCASFLIGAMMLSLAACSGSTKKIESPADFEGAKISVQTATSAHESIQDMQDEGMNINVLPYEKVTQCFDDLALGRVDAVYVDSVVAGYYLAEDDTKYRKTWTSESGEPIGVCLKKGNDDLKELIEGAIDTLYYDGTMAQLSEKHFGSAADVDGDMSGNELNFITAYAGGLRTFLMTRAAGRHYDGAQEAVRRVDIPGGKQSGGAAKAAGESEKPEKKTAEKEETLDELMAQLDSLIGLETVKREVRSLINLIKVRAMRKEHDLKVMNMSFHMVFTGNPGTGKTTVARLVAKIYKQLGFLSKGQLIETDRSGLVAGYVGQTAGKVTDVVNSALGGILFIDEAYALVRKGMENDFGHEAIDTLVKLMEDHRDDLVVIVAGYTDEMHDFLTSNPGLISRFNKYIDFPDYTDDELMAILEMNAGRQGYRVAEAAKAVVRGMLTQMTLSERMDFGNARGMRNTLEKLVQAQANRLAACEGEVTRDMLEEITEADAKAALVGEEEQKQADSENVAQLAERGEQE